MTQEPGQDGEEQQPEEGFDTDAIDLGEEVAADSAPDPVDVLTEEVATLKDSLLRARAETENVRRRAEKDRADASAYAVTGFARDMLNVVDNLRRALDTLPDDQAEDMKGFVEGVELTERELLNTLERHGIQKVEPQAGDKFDPNRHQAMFEVPTEELPAGSLVQVVNPGYVIKDRLLRPAMVGVAKGDAPKVDTEA